MQSGSEGQLYDSQSPGLEYSHDIYEFVVDETNGTSLLFFFFFGHCFCVKV